MPLGKFAKFVITSYSSLNELETIVDRAAKNTSGTEELQFNVFDADLNYDDDKVTLHDVLEADVKETCSLTEFIAAIHERYDLPRG